MPTERKATAGPAIIAAVLMLVVLPVLYVAGLGPAVWLHEHGGVSPNVKRAIEVVYLPLDLICDASPPVSDTLAWYIRLWVEDR